MHVCVCVCIHLFVYMWRMCVRIFQFQVAYKMKNVLCVYDCVPACVCVCVCVANGCTFMFYSLGSEGVKMIQTRKLIFEFCILELLFSLLFNAHTSNPLKNSHDKDNASLLWKVIKHLCKTKSIIYNNIQQNANQLEEAMIMNIKNKYNSTSK